MASPSRISDVDSRAGLYRFDPDKERRDHDLDLRDAIQRIALEFPCYGRHTVSAMLLFAVICCGFEGTT
jgi:hypothetical protein